MAPKPVVPIRAVMPDDSRRLIDVAATQEFRTVNFTRKRLPLKIAASMDSFAGRQPSAKEAFMFVASSGTEPDAMVVGTSTLYSSHGTAEDPYFVYRIDENHNRLVLTKRLDGAAELAAIVTDKGARKGTSGITATGGTRPHYTDTIKSSFTFKGGYGRPLSWVRFFWAAMPSQREKFRGRQAFVAFLPPYYRCPGETIAKDQRTNAFYEFLRNNFGLGGMYFDQADDFFSVHPDQIPHFLPHEIDLADEHLDRHYDGVKETPRGTIQSVGEETQKADEMLEQGGIVRTDQMYILDGGKLSAGPIESHPMFRGARDVLFKSVSDGNELQEGWHYGLIGYDQPFFRACAGPFAWTASGEIRTTAEVADNLQLLVGQSLLAAPFPKKIG